jgi:GT2 family glycosyltransferase
VVDDSEFGGDIFETLGSLGAVIDGSGLTSSAPKLAAGLQLSRHEPLAKNLRPTQENPMVKKRNRTMRYDALVSTLNRPQSLKACLSLIEGQTEKPARVIIVDASDNHHEVKAEVMQSRDPAIEWTFLRSDTKSLPYQRNLGLEHVESPVVLLPDDDSMLHPQAAAGMLAAYRLDDRHEIGGVSGVGVASAPQQRRTRQIARTRALKERIQPVRNMLENRFVPKPFSSYPRELWSKRSVPNWIDGKRFTLVESIVGYLLSLRSDVIKQHRFDETLGYGIGYALHEDGEVSLRLQKCGYLLIAAHGAPIFHDVHPSKRAGGFNYGFCWISNYIYTCRRNMPETSIAWREHLSNFIRYKLALYRARALVKRDDYSREVFLGAQAAWGTRGPLMSADPESLQQVYKQLCDAYIQR